MSDTIFDCTQTDWIKGGLVFESVNNDKAPYNNSDGISNQSRLKRSVLLLSLSVIGCTLMVNWMRASYYDEKMTPSQSRYDESSQQKRVALYLIDLIILHEICSVLDEVKVPVVASRNQPCDDRMEVAAPVCVLNLLFFVNAIMYSSPDFYIHI